MYKLIILILLIFAPSLVYSTSLGVWPAKINTTILPFKTNYEYIYFFNPGDKDIEIKIDFICDGDKNIIKKLNMNIYPDRILIEKNTTQFNSERILITFDNPLFIRKIFSFYIFGRKIDIPFYSIIFNNNTFECMITATTLNEKTPIIVTSKIDLELVGINSLKFIFLLLFTLLILLIASYLYYKKIYNINKRKKCSIDYFFLLNIFLKLKPNLFNIKIIISTINRTNMMKLLNGIPLAVISNEAPTDGVTPKVPKLDS